MEIKDLVSYYINDSSKTLDVTFRLTSDSDDEIRTDQIQLNEIESFGYNFDRFSENTLLDMFDEDDNDEFMSDFMDDDFVTEEDEDEIKLFLNEYYLIYRDKLPNSELF